MKASSDWLPRRENRFGSPGCCAPMLYANAVAKRAQERGVSYGRAAHSACPDCRNPESQLGIPLIVRDELIGVLCIETDRSYRFHEEDRAYIEVLGGYLAIAIQNALLRERTEDPEERPAASRGRRCAACGAGTPLANQCGVLQKRRVHPRRRRVPRAEPAGKDSVEAAARESRGRIRGVYKPPAAPR